MTLSRKHKAGNRKNKRFRKVGSFGSDKKRSDISLRSRALRTLSVDELDALDMQRTEAEAGRRLQHSLVGASLADIAHSDTITRDSDVMLSLENAPDPQRTVGWVLDNADEVFSRPGFYVLDVDNDFADLTDGAIRARIKRQADKRDRPVSMAFKNGEVRLTVGSRS